MHLSHEALADLLRKNPSLARANADLTAQRLPASVPEQAKPNSLDRSKKAKGPSRKKPAVRFRVRFDCYMVRPQDWDNTYVKPLQDGLRKAGIITDDAWDEAEGSVACHKVSSFDQDETVITVTRLV